MTFLVQGAIRFKQPGVLMTFEERSDDISANVESLGYDLPGLIASKSLAIDQAAGNISSLAVDVENLATLYRVQGKLV